MPPQSLPQDEAVQPIKVLVYSTNREVRAQVLAALGRRPAMDLPPVEMVETATEAATIRRMDKGGIDLVILDGEAQPGGMGIARQLKDEIFQCPPTLLLTGRPQDAWLATWSRADAVVPRPLSPYDLARAAAELLRRRLAGAAGR
jgi:DNA-binding response OmpR family regulator